MSERPRPEHAAQSFLYPFRAGWPRAWVIGVPLAILCPIGIVPLLGYTVGAARLLPVGCFCRAATETSTASALAAPYLSAAGQTSR